MQMPCSKFRGGRLILIFESLIPSGDENIDPPGECVQLPFYTCLLVTVANSEKWDKCYGYEIVSKIFPSRILIIIIITNLLGKIENTFNISEKNLQCHEVISTLFR